MPKIEMARLALASEKPDTCTGPPRLPSPQGAKQEAHLVITDNFPTFPQIADRAAQDKEGKHWRSHVDDYFGAVVGDFWRGRFEQVFHSTIGFASQTPDTITREVTWSVLGAPTGPRCACTGFVGP